MTNDKTSIESIAPITVTMVGSGGGTGDGAPISNNQMLHTPDHQPNVIVKVVTPIVALLIRFGNAYVTALVGLVTVGLTTDALPAADFYHLVVRCAGLSLAGPAVAAAKDAITIFQGLEKKFPLLTGSV